MRMTPRPNVGSVQAHEVIVPEARQHFQWALRAGLVATAVGGFGLAAAADGWRYVAAGSTAFGVWLLVIAGSHLGRRSPQLIADDEGVRCKIWRGYRRMRWNEVTSIGPVERQMGPTPRVRVGGGRSIALVPASWDQRNGRNFRGFMIRSGPKLLHGCLVIEEPGTDLTAAHRQVVHLWANATGHHPTRAQSDRQAYVLSGFEDAAAFEARCPSWTPADGTSPSDQLEGCVARAQAWVASQGPGAMVEVISVAGRQGCVVRVVTADAVESIGEFDARRTTSSPAAFPPLLP